MSSQCCTLQDWTTDEFTGVNNAGLDNGRIHSAVHCRTEQWMTSQCCTLQDWTTDEFTAVDTAGLDNDRRM